MLFSSSDSPWRNDMARYSNELTETTNGNLQVVRTDAQAIPVAMVGDATGSGPVAMDAQQQERLLVEHLPTVRYIARKIHAGLPQQVELEDLISAGIIGLLDAF